MVTRAETERLRNELVQRQRAALLRQELVENELTVTEKELRPSADEINRRYDRGEIRIVTEQARYPLGSITALLETDNYQLDPEYQRRHRWTPGQKSRLIESFIMNVPVPPIFLYEYDYNRYEVMDGLQRLTAVREFYGNRFRLEGLEYWEVLEGLTYDGLPSRIKDGINRRYLSSIILLKETSHGEEDPEHLKRFVFGRINTGGVKLSHQEVRNALYDGPMNRLCKQLAMNLSLRRLWGIPENVEELVEPNVQTDDPEIEGFDLDLPIAEKPQRIPRAWREMMDVELVLRFFANRQRMIVYRDNIRDYLDDYLQAANGFPLDTLEQLSSVFQRTATLAEDLFGPIAFRRPRPRGEGWGDVPSVSIYDALMNVLSRMLDDTEKLRSNREQIRSGMLTFYSEHSQVFNLRGQTRSDVMIREVELESYLRSAISER